MQSDHLQKIKRLVDASNLLTPQERGEWTALLALMNDKQLSELEKILAIENVPVAPKPLSAPPVASKPQPPVLPLSHIVNLPRTMPQGQVKTPVPAATFLKDLPTPSVARPAPELAEKKNPATSGWLAKLKNAISEKELPAGHAEPQNELELPARAEAASPQPKPVVSPVQLKPIAPQKPKAPPVVPRPAPKIPKEENLVVKNLVTSNLQVLSSETEAKKKIPTSPSIQPSPSAKLETKPPFETKEQKKFATPPPGIPAGISFPKPSAQLQQQTLANIKEHLADRHIAVPDHPPEVQGSDQAPQLGSLEAVTELKPKALTAGKGVTSQLKKLVSQYGYHVVAFNLEKSDLYKTYIRTGIELLKENVSFDELVKNNGSTYMTRSQFENFTDMLRQIQAG